MQSPQPASSPAPTLLESTLSAVAAAVLLRAPLPAQVVALLRALFPSAAELLASAPAADGLGLEVCSLLPAPAAPREQLAAPLPAGGALCFGLRKGPAPGELALMEAFAAALAARLGQLDASLQVRCGVCAVLCRAVPCPRGGAIDWRGGRVRCMGTPTLDCPDRRLRGACSQACTRVLCHSSTFASRPRPTPPPPPAGARLSAAPGDAAGGLPRCAACRLLLGVSVGSPLSAAVRAPSTPLYFVSQLSLGAPVLSHASPVD